MSFGVGFSLGRGRDFRSRQTGHGSQPRPARHLTSSPCVGPGWASFTVTGGWCHVILIGGDSPLPGSAKLLHGGEGGT